MATTSPKRSPYKQRRIDVMLNEEAAPPPPPPALPSSPRTRQNPLPLSRAPWNQIFSSTRSRIIVSLGIAAALFCIIVGLFALFRRDAAPAPRASEARNTVSPATVPASAAPVPSPAPAQQVPQQQAPPSEPVQFHLKRSKTFEKVGPIRLRLVKANARRNTCDLYINSGGPSYQKQTRLNKPVSIDFNDGSGSAELVVTDIKGDQISGSVQPKQ